MARTKAQEFDNQRQAPDEKVNANSMDQLGVSGIKIQSGFIHDEFIQRLTGERGRAVYREMRDNDSTVGSILFAVEMLLRAVEWRIEYAGMDETGSSAPDKSESEAQGFRSITDPDTAVSFLEGILFDDMNHTWDDFIGTVLSMLTFGWQYTEICWKRRLGLNEDQDKSSIFDDGMIGIAKLADRSQETLDKWDRDNKGMIYGMWQQDPNGGPNLYIPMAKALLFRPHAFKESPEGRSILRTVYRSWYFLKNIQEIEAIAIERELNGLPVMYIPNTILNGTTDESKRAVALYTKMVRDVKFNEQAGMVLPSDPYYDAEGAPSNIRQVEFKLLNAEGSRAIDTDKVIKRYQGDIARTILAQFILLSQSGNKGGYAQSKSEIDLFLRATEGWLESIASVINRHLVPKIWSINGLDPTIMPYVVPGKVAPEDLGELGDFVQKLAAAGIILSDPATEDHLRSVAGLPEGIIHTEDELIFDSGEEDLIPGKDPNKPKEEKTKIEDE